MKHRAAATVIANAKAALDRVLDDGQSELAELWAAEEQWAEHISDLKRELDGKRSHPKAPKVDRIGFQVTLEHARTHLRILVFRWLGKYSESLGRPARVAADESALAAYLETNCYVARPPAKRAARAVALDLEFFGVSGFKELRDGAGTAFLHCDESWFLHVRPEPSAGAPKEAAGASRLARGGERGLGSAERTGAGRGTREHMTTAEPIKTACVRSCRERALATPMVRS